MTELLRILGDAGPVGVALLGVGFLQWWVAYLRFAAIDGCLQPLTDLNARLQVNRGSAAPASTAAFAEQRLIAWKNVLRSMVASAPLLGLLGTVGGMIETFATLHVSGLAHADASVAGGISTALLTTQLGLLVSVPGLIAARTLDRFEERRRQHLARLVTALSGRASPSDAFASDEGAAP